MTVAFATKLAYFTADPDTVEVECQECGRLFETSKNQKTRAKFCPDCRRDAYNLRKLNHHKDKREMPNEMGDPTINFVYAMYEQALRDARKGDRDAWQWLATDLELWLLCCGLSPRPSEIERVRRGV